MIEYMPPIIFITLIIFLMSGFPVAFSLAAVGLVFSVFGIFNGFFDANILNSLGNRIFGIISNDTLLAIPFFTFMGLILERSGLAENLLNTMGELFGKVRGGLAYSVIIVGALLAATTGVVSASVIAMGLISLPIMLRYGYSPKIASGVIAASGTLAQIIPPSLVLIVLGSQLNVSIGDMYHAAIIPSAILVGLYFIYIFILSIIFPKSMPALPEEARTTEGVDLLVKSLLSIAPPLILIGLVLGTVLKGIATPTEAGSVGAVGALILAMLQKKINKQIIYQALDSTVKITTFVMFIMIGSSVFSLVFTAFDGGKWIEHLLTGLPGKQLGFIIAVNIMVFFIAFFLDFFEIALILVPLLYPVAVALDINLVWFAVLLAMNMQTSFMHPPFGFSLFYLRSVAPSSVKTTDIYWGALPFLGLQIFTLILLIAFPNVIKTTKKDTFTGSGSEINFAIDSTDDNLEENYFEDYEGESLDFN